MKRLGVLGVSAMLVIAAAACGGDDDDGSAATSTDPAAVATTVAEGESETTVGGSPATTVGGSPATTADEPPSSAVATTPATDGPADPEGEPQMGGEVTYIMQAAVPGWDPVQCLLSCAAPAGTYGTQYSIVYDNLIVEDPVTGELTPRLAESIESDDAKVWTIKIRPDVVFSDGAPFDADAVRINWERHADPALASGNASTVAAFESVEVIDPLTLQVTLVSPNGQFPRVIARQIGSIASPQAIADGVDLANNPVGAGPFTLESYTRDSGATFVKNPTFWDAPRPYLDRVELRWVTDTEQRFNSVRTGEVDIALIPVNPEYKPRAEAEGLQTVQFGFSGGLAYVLNTERPPFDDVVARQAFAHALNYEGLNEAIFAGAGSPVSSFFTEDSPFYNADLQLPGYDPALAQELFDEYLATHGEPVSVKLMATPSGMPAAEYYQAQLTEFANVEVTVEQFEVTDYATVAGGRDWDVLHAQVATVDPEPDMYSAFFSESPRNYGVWSNAAVDEAVQLGRTSLDQAERREAYNVVQQALIDEVPVVFNARTIVTAIAQERVHGLLPLSNYIINFDQIWVSEE